MLMVIGLITVCLVVRSLVKDQKKPWREKTAKEREKTVLHNGAAEIVGRVALFGAGIVASFFYPPLWIGMLLVGWRVLKPIPDIARASANFKSTGDPTEHAPDDISGVGV